MTTLAPDAVLIAGAVLIWVSAGIAMNVVLARIFGWKKDQP